MQYREERENTRIYKKQYRDGLTHLIAQRQKEAAENRRAYVRDIFSEPERYRSELKNMLGWPLTETEERVLPSVTEEKLAEEDGFDVYRLQFSVLDGLVMTGLFFRADGEEKKPLVIVQHGGVGTPELISGVYGGTSNYNDMLHRVIRHGVHAFSPQLLLWHEDYGVPFNRQQTDTQLKMTGSSVAAVEIYGIQRILDYFQSQEYVSSFGMVGLSYGGFYTLFAAAIDTRIRSAISCSFFNEREQYPKCDWTWLHSSEKFGDAEVACLVYPRRLCIGFGSRDELFTAEPARRELARLKELCAPVGVDWLDGMEFDGKHEFLRDDAPIARLIADLNQISE